jgi:single-strand DNA-binding protein
MIKLQFIGNLGHDVIRKEINGTSVLSFRAAHSRRFTNQQGEKKEHTIWVDCSFWEHVNVAPYLTKGTQVYVEGIPTLEAYVTNAGEPAAGLKLRVTNLQLLGSKREDSVQQEDTTVTNDIASEADDLPF